MKRIILGTILAVAATAAMATKNQGDTQNGAIHHNGGNATAFGGTGGNATAFGGTGGSATIQSGAVRNEIENRNTVVVEGDTVKAPASPAAVSAAGTTAVCRVAGGVSVAGMVGGVAVSGSVEDENCAKIEAGKAAIWAGNAVGDEKLMARGAAVISDNLSRFEKKEAAKVEQRAVRPTSATMDAPAFSVNP